MSKALKTAATIFAVTFLVVTGLASVGMFASGVAAAGSIAMFGLEMAALSSLTTLVGGLLSKGTSSTVAENFGSKVSTRSAVAPRQIVYGRCRVGGTITHIETRGTDNFKLQMVIVLAGHEIDALEEVLVNDEVLTTTAGSGDNANFQLVTNSKFTNTDNENNFGSGRLMRFVFVDGSQTTANSTVTNACSLGSNDKFIGCAYLYIEMVFDSEAFGGGIPPLSFVVRGKKVFDPRDSSTAWSENPALCVRDYITNTSYGLKATSSEVNDTINTGGFILAANTCDLKDTVATATTSGTTSSSKNVNINSAPTNTLIDVGHIVTGTGISGTVTVIKRRLNTITLSSVHSITNGTTLTFKEGEYTANGISNMSASGKSVLEGLLSACAGKLSYIDGKFVMFAGASVSPTMTITDDNLLAPVTITTKQSSGESYNTVKAVYVDANTNYVATDSPVLTPINPLSSSNKTFLFEDTPTGETQANYRKTLEIQLPFTDTSSMAQRLQKTALIHHRKEVTLSVMCNIGFMQLQPFDWVYVTNERLGYTNKTFEVLSTNLEVIGDADAPVLATALALKEIDVSVYSFAQSDYTNPIDEGSALSTGSFTVTAPTNLSVTATLVNTGYDLQVQWVNNPSNVVQGTEILFGTSSGTYLSSAIAGKGKTKEIIPNVKANTTYYIVARHFSGNNVFSSNTSEETINTNSDNNITTPSAPSSLSATTGKPLSIGLSWQNPSNSDLRDIKIYRSTTSGFTPTDSGASANLVRTVAGVPSAVQKVSFGVDDGLVEGTTYYFKVKAVSYFDKVSTASNQAAGAFTKVEATDIDGIFSGYFHVEGTTTTAQTDSAFNTAHGRLPIKDDILIMVKTNVTPKISKAYKYIGVSGSGGSFSEISNFTTGDLVVDGTLAGSKIIADTVNGNVFQATTKITAGTGNNVGVLDGGDSTFRIYAGHSSPSSAPFKVSQLGAVTATSGTVGGFTLGTTSLTNPTANSKIQIGSGSSIFTVDSNGIYTGNSSFASAPFKVNASGSVQTTNSFTAGTTGTSNIAVISGSDATYRFWSGNQSPTSANFSVDKTGKVVAQHLVLKLLDGTVFFDSSTGFTSSALSQISTTTGTKVSTISSTFDADTEFESVTVTEQTTVNVSVSLNTLFGGSGSSNQNEATSISNSEADIPDNFTLVIQHSSDGGANYSNLKTQQFTKVNTGTPSATQYKITTNTTILFIGGQGGIAFESNSSTDIGSGCVDSTGNTVLTHTGLVLTVSGVSTTHRIKATVSTTDSSYDTINKVTSTAPRVLQTTDPSGSGFYVSDGDGTQVAPSGDITRVQITTDASSGLTGGANFLSGDALFSLGLASTIAGNKTFSNNIIIGGNLDVQGTTTTIDTANLDVKDKNITLNYSTGDSSANANGAGITIQDAVSAGNDATLTWNTANDSFNFSHNLNFADNVKAQFGASNDLQIFHDGNNSYVSDVGLGSLILRGTNLFLQNGDGSQDYITCSNGGAVNIKHAGSTKLTTNSTGIDVTSNLTLNSATTAPVLKLSNNSNSISAGDNLGLIEFFSGDDSGGGDSVKSTISTVQPATSPVSGEMVFKTSESTGSLTERLRVKATGIDVTGVITTDGMTTSADINFGDNDKAVFNSNLNIFSTGTSSYIEEVGTGDLYLKASNLYITDRENNQFMSMIDNGTGGTLSLKHLGSTVLTTQSTGIDVTGTAVTDGLTTNGASEGDTYFTGGTANSRLLNVFTSTHDSAANAGHNFKIASGQGAFIFGNNTTANLLTVKTGGIDVTGTATMDGLTVVGETTSGNGTYGTKLTYSNSNQSGIIDTFGNHSLEFRANNDRAMNIAANGDISFYEDTGTNPKFFWDASAERLGINTTSPDAALEVNSGGGIHLTDNTAGRTLIIKPSLTGSVHEFTSDNTAAGYSFSNSSSELMRIDASGNLTNIASITVTGQSLVASGAVSAPSYAFFNDSDTGISRPTTNALNFVTGGVERLRIDSIGRIGLSGANYGSSGQVLTSNGNSHAPSWQASSGVVTTYTNGANNRIITSTGAAGINGEGNLTFDGSTLGVTGAITSTGQIKAQSDFVLADSGGTNRGFLFGTSSGVFARFNSGLNFQVQEGGSTRFTIASGGAATFNSTISSGAITATTLISDAGNNYSQVKLSGDNGTNGDSYRFTLNNDNTLLLQRSTDNFVGNATLALTIDSSQNATFSGTISSGAITTSSDITLNGGHDIHLVKTHPNNGVDMVYGQITFGDTTGSQYVNHARIESGGNYANESDLRFHTSSNNSSPVRFQMTKIGEFKVGTTTILDQSRNLTNIGTISSGAITSTGLLSTINAANTINKFKTTNNSTRSTLSLESKDSSGNAVDLRMHALGDGARGELFTFTNHDLGFATNNAAPQMILKTSGNVGIGHSPVYRLDVKGTGSTLARFVSASDDALVRIISNNYGTEADSRLFLGENDVYGMTVEYDGVANIGYIGMNDNVQPNLAYSKRIQMSRAGTEVAFMAGNVGIGKVSPSEKLDIVGNIGLAGELKLVTAIRHANSGVQVIDNDNNTYFIINDPEGANRILIGDSADRTTEIRNDTIKFATASGSEKARLDSSGNLLVGTTDSTPYNNNAGSAADNGIVLSEAGWLAAARYQGTVAFLNRTGNDGDIAVFRKNGTTVGSIGTRSTGLIVGNGDVGLHFDAQVDRIFPESPSGGSARDNAIDLGTSAARFKDLYLSGTARSNTVSINGTTVIDASRNLTNIAGITSSGDAKIGNTVTNPASGFNNQKGFGYTASSGKVEIATTADSAALEIGKNQANNGDLLVFRKQSNTVGSIGAYSGSLYLGGGDVGFGFYQGADAIVPFNPSTVGERDNAINLGSSGYRFKDLYLSGTAGVNALDIKSGSSIHGTITTSSSSLTLNARNTGIMIFQSGGSQKLRIDASGNLQMGASSTTVIDASRNLTNIGTVTTSGVIQQTASEGREIRTYMPSSYTTNDIVSGHEYGWYSDYWRVGISRSGDVGGEAFRFNYSGSYVAQIGTTGIFDGTGYRVNGTTVIDASRNLTNIGTISSGAITSSASLKATDYRVNEGNSLAGGLFKEKNVTGSGSSNDLSIFAESISNGGNIHFMTGGSATIRATIDSSGRVGVGQTPLGNNFSLQVTGLGGGSGDARAVYLKGSGAHTSIGSTGPTLVLQNTNSTTNNIVKLSFESASSGETVSINAINTNHGSHYGDIAFNTRGSAGYSEKFRIDSSGNIKHGASQTTIIDASRNLTNIGSISAGFTHLQKAGSSGVQTIVAVIGSTSLRPVLQFSESTAVTINAGMSIEYNGVGTGATNYMSINAVTGASMFQFSSGGDFRLGSTTVIDASRNLTNIGTGNFAGAVTATDNVLTGNAPLSFTNNGSGTFNRSVIYNSQNNTSNNVYNGITIECGRLSDSSTAEVRHFTVAARGGQVRFKVDANSNGIFAGDVQAYSDERLKDNIQTLDGKKALQMRGVSFTRDGKPSSGVIAQEVEKIAPELVMTADDEMGTKSVAYGNLVGYLIETVKDQQAQIDELKAMIEKVT